MADSKVSALTELTAFTGDETFYVVEDDDGTPASRRVTLENLAAGLAARPEFDPLEFYSTTATPDALNDEFNGSVDGAWVNHAPTGVAVWTQGRHALSVQTTTAVASGDIAVRVKPGTIASGECFETQINAMQPQADAMGVLLMLTTGNADASVPLGVGLYMYSSGPALWTVTGGTLTSWGTSSVPATLYSGSTRNLKVRIRRTGSQSYQPEFSTDGLVWTAFGIAAFTGIATAFTHVGFGVSNAGGGNISGIARFEYIRKYTA